MQATFRIPTEYNTVLRAEAELSAVPIAVIARARMRAALADPKPLTRMPPQPDLSAPVVMRVPDALYADIVAKAAEVHMSVSEAMRTMVCGPAPGEDPVQDVVLHLPKGLHDVLAARAQATGETLQALVSRVLEADALRDTPEPEPTAPSIYD